MLENPEQHSDQNNESVQSKMLLDNILKASATLSPFLLNGTFNYDLIFNNPIFSAVAQNTSNLSLDIPSSPTEGFSFPLSLGTNYGNDNAQPLTNSSDSSGQSTPKSVKCSSPRRAKSPNHIKRPMNAFMIWAKGERKKIVEEEKKNGSGTTLHNSSISKMLGMRWNSLSEEEKQPFKEEQKKHKAAHYEKYPDYIFKPRRRKSRVSSDGEKSLEFSNLENGFPPQFAFLKNFVDQAVLQPVE